MDQNENNSLQESAGSNNVSVNQVPAGAVPDASSVQGAAANSNAPAVSGSTVQGPPASYQSHIASVNVNEGSTGFIASRGVQRTGGDGSVGRGMQRTGGDGSVLALTDDRFGAVKKVSQRKIDALVAESKSSLVTGFFLGFLTALMCNLIVLVVWIVCRH